MTYKYIPDKGLSNLKEYKYSSRDRSLLANYVMQPFWNFMIKLMPHSIAPNVITLIGFIAILVSYWVTLVHSPDGETKLPLWVMTLNCACLFFYQLFDALDGKQARRTKSSSPLGELFDHGCDAMTTVFMTLTVNMSLRLGMGWWFYTNVLVLMILFYHSQWEVYPTFRLLLTSP
eukprot:TRINITY_DN2311_c0_g1_i1.p1 TRINITY_DN2311_c0_g1~~TRINITY_DN2311_c0_g1_i1.p1  ORF type:complete len:175 (+),score=4.50 TRINITY_DN2311_c0_g1_i1:100-624(+)